MEPKNPNGRRPPKSPENPNPRRKNLMTETTEERDWSSIPTDALELISKLLSFDPDYVRFRSVCGTWRRSAPKRPQVPWLIAYRNGPNGDHTIFSFYKLLVGEYKIVPIPEQLPEFDLFGGMKCIGSSHGWMALASTRSDPILLFNPLTKSTMHFPAPLDLSTLTLSSDPATASSEFLVSSCFAFHRVGDVGWTPLQCPQFRGWEVRSCFYRGSLYVLSLCDPTELYVCDLSGPNPIVREIASLSCESAGLPMIYHGHLVESDGDLLLVLAYCPGSYKDRGYWFKVYKLELGEKVKLVKLERLGDRALFLSPYNAISVSTSQFPGCKENIYYDWICNRPDQGATRRLKVYNLKDAINYSIPENRRDFFKFKDKSDVFVNDDTVLRHGDWGPCAWFTPSLLKNSE